MILPILSYGYRILREKCKAIDSAYPQLEQLIQNMWETLYRADGCGLAAPQVNHPIRLFIVDSKQTYAQMDTEERKKYFADDQGIQETFLNATLLDYSQETWTDPEGCLSMPSIREGVERPWQITIQYFDQQFEKQQKTFNGITARMIQHEYDHIEGILYIDRLNPLNRTLLKNKLKKIAEGKIKANYQMKFPK